MTGAFTIGIPREMLMTIHEVGTKKDLSIREVS